LRRKCTEFAPDPAGTLTAPPDLLAVCKGLLLRGGKGRDEGEEGEVKGREWERRWREGFGPHKNFRVAPGP